MEMDDFLKRTRKEKKSDGVNRKIDGDEIDTSNVLIPV